LKPSNGVSGRWVREVMTDRYDETESTDETTTKSTSEETVQSTDETTKSTDVERGTDGRLNRRTLLKGTAAAGLAGSGLAGNAGATSEREVTFCAAGDATFSYQISVSGEVMRGGTYESDSFDEIVDENTARGAVAEKRCDSWLFTGEPTDLQLEGPGKVFVDGELFEDTTKDEPELPNRILVQGEGKSAQYKFRVSGQVRKGEFANDGDNIDGNTVRGVVAGGKDSYRYSGSLCFDESSGPVTVTLDVNP
jgi:hypothetical protein